MARKSTSKKSSRVTLEDLKEELDEIRERLTSIEGDEERELLYEKNIEHAEAAQLSELERLEKLEEEIAADVGPHPLKRITYRDITKGIIGAFFGVVGHFAFFYGEKLAHDISVGRATGLLMSSILLLVLFIYLSGFRQIQSDYKHRYVPWRVIVLFVTANTVALLVLLLFGRISIEMPLSEIYKNLAAVSILAVGGAATADLIGGEVE